ncbi:hypothetical protein DICPUDRAFT_160158 [Dictyostelium purpureum]|uniref:Superoxide dismutase copper/zinc binding domain-containing protein n=1 Tax=Dictyostelium purpureum TaxID=5786 RepID=F1A5U0_DICPU|nr:uncharacterized protein DICPUDRAFT_160158 [Dictyostelium purpureum]EGC28441.1 hypothetical protein DICPUDRAFT_160158 [Dictyostelium purpureum]|eukprot:XP_003295034.1 hypothetical protein DICPUDRAFT_160158 [Dictyostelium purpureum]
MRFISLLIVFFLLKSAIVLADYEYAVCDLVPVDKNSPSISGSIQIYKNLETDSNTEFLYEFSAINGLKDGSYGISIQTYGYPLSDLGGVFDPENLEGACPNQKDSMVGALYDVVMSEGIVSSSFSYLLPLLSGENSIIGRSIVIYNASLCPNDLTRLSAQLSVQSEASVIASCVIGYGNDTTRPEFLDGLNKASAPTISVNAIAVLQPTSSNAITGQVAFAKVEGGVQVTSKINGLSKEAHGFHIHSFGQLSTTGSALGGHWAATGQTHSLPSTLQNSNTRHYGDLGNICAFDSAFKNAYYNFTTNYISIQGVYGRGFAVHATRDLGDSNVGGARILQGVIAMVNPSTSTDVNTPPTPDFAFDNICAEGAFNGETNSTSSGSGSESESENSSSQLVSSLFILGLFSSLFVLLF